jgi:hypothetical protein
MSDHSATEGAVEEDAFPDLFDALVTHACWPVPPAAWGRLFVAAAALSELSDPAEPHPDGRMAGAGLRLMIRILDRAHGDFEDHRQLRTFLPLVCGRSKPVDGALRRAEERVRGGGLSSGHEGAASLLERLAEDATGRMIRGLTAGAGADQADEDRPDLAENLRNPYALADRLDRVRERLTLQLVKLIRDGSPDLRFMDRFAALVPLAEAAAELRGTRGLAPDELRVVKTDETLMRLLEAVGPDLVPEPARPAARPDPTARRKRLPSAGTDDPDPDNPYLRLRTVELRSRAVGAALDRLRDQVRSLRSGDGGHAGRRLPEPANLDAFERTLKRVRSGR